MFTIRGILNYIHIYILQGTEYEFSEVDSAVLLFIIIMLELVQLVRSIPELVYRGSIGQITLTTYTNWRCVLLTSVSSLLASCSP